MSLHITTPPAAEPVTPQEVYDRLRITTPTDEDVRLVVSGITAAREYAEKITGRSLATKSYAYYLDGFPFPGYPLRLPAPPLVSVTSIKYLDSELVWQTWAPAEYFAADKQVPALIVPKPTRVYPCPANVPGSVEIIFTAGVDPAEHLKEGIRQLAVHIYEHPEPISPDAWKQAPLALTSFFLANKVYVF